MTAVAHGPADAVERRGAPRRSWWRPAIAICVPTYLLGAHSAWYGPWIVDDAGITFAYARSLATGAGPVLQAGADPVEGWSNPTWLRCSSSAAGWGCSTPVPGPGRRISCCSRRSSRAGVFACCYAVAREVARHPVAVTVVAGTTVAAIPSFAIWTTSGLENALFALVVMAIAAVLARAAVGGRLPDRRTAVVCGLLAAAAALTRPDGLVYAAAYPLALLLLPDRATLRAAAASTAVFAVPVGAYLAWRLVTFGDHLPNPARAEEQGLPTLAGLGRPT